MADPKWMVAEFNGHNRHIGKVSEETVFGAPLVRVDVLLRDGAMREVFYGHAAIYRLQPVSEEQARELVLPTGRGRACLAFKQPSARPGLCSECGNAEQAHVERAKLPPPATFEEPDGSPLDAEDDLPV